MSDSLECHIYRSKQKTGLYVYLLEKDDFSVIPKSLITRVGKLEFNFSMQLTEAKKLARLDAKQVISQLKKDRFFIQLPPANSHFLDLDFKQSDGF